MCKEYNGWSNYETWAVQLWLENDEGTYHFVLDLLDEARNAELGEYEEPCMRFETMLKDWIDEFNPLAYRADMYSDLLGAALCNVDWREIAHAWDNDYPEEVEEVI